MEENIAEILLYEDLIKNMRINMQNNKIVLLKGDGIGPEIIDSAISVLRKIESIENITFDLEEASIGGAAIDQFGNPFPRN